MTRKTHPTKRIISHIKRNTINQIGIRSGQDINVQYPIVDFAMSLCVVEGSGGGGKTCVGVGEGIVDGLGGD